MTFPNGTMDILLAEDDIDDVDIFNMAMQSLGINYELRNAKNGDLLFVLLKDKLPYILFLDVRMPCRDGLSCIREIRKNKDYDRLPVIMYSTYASQQAIEELHRNGANLYFQKTSTFAELVKNLKTILSYDWDTHPPHPTIDQFILS